MLYHSKESEDIFAIKEDEILDEWRKVKFEEYRKEVIGRKKQKKEI